MPTVIAIPATRREVRKTNSVQAIRRKVVGYARVSTDHDEQLTSYEAQMEYYTRYIKEHDGWEYAGMYSDEGITATNTKNRDGFNQMVTDALAGKFNLIITKSVSRFARNTVDSLVTVRKLKEAGVEVYFEKENIWTLDSKGDVLPSEMIQCNNRCKAARPLDIWAFGRWLPFGGLLFCPESDGGGAAGVHTLLTMNTILTIAWGIVKRVWAIVNRVQIGTNWERVFLTSAIKNLIIGTIKSFAIERKNRPMENTTNLYTVSDVAGMLKVSPQYVREIIRDDKLSAKRVGSQWLVKDSDLEGYLVKSDICIEPDDHERLTSDVPKIVALSFFSGALGLDIGMSNGGIDALLTCESNKYCRMTIQQNNPKAALIGDINNYSAEEILRMAKIPKGRKVDIIFGGPPCQAFSTAGARRALDDERGNVFLRYIDIVEKIKPTYVVIENVRGLLSAPYPYKEITSPIKGGALCIILDRLKAAGYTVSFELYNAANFGAPQIRERVVMIGKLGKEKVPYLSPTHSETGMYGLKKWRTLREIFERIDIPECEQHHINFPEKRLKYYRMLGEGQYWKDLPPDVQAEAMGEKLKLGGGKTGFFRRLSYSKPSPTLVTNPAMPATDLCHPTEDRPLSVEEYKSIQEFPRECAICGPILEKYKQIGNAVPIKLGEAIARTILADMEGKHLPSYQGFTFSRYKNTSDVSWQIAMDKAIKKELRTKDNSQVSLFN